MQTPSQGVVPTLQNHVHLISNHRFPIIQSLSIDQALTYLLDAPTIVKSVAPMSWTYVQPPSDGTLWLEWLDPSKTDGRFPSDGYIWGDSEATYRQEHRGYTIEMMRHTIGYRMQVDQMASHARTRYHIIAKNPSVAAPPPDPALWIVHYHPTDQQRMLPSTQVPFTPQTQQTMTERRWLEAQGRLERKDFMLHDRQSWPMIQVPNQRAAPMPQQFNPARAQPRQQHPGWPQSPPNKKPRMTIPGPGAPADMMHDTSIEDEENTAVGDFFDNLTPRDISMTRYMQHHRWMEEVFSSPYATNQIVPADLGLGLMGELKGLTEGILEPPSLDFAQADKPAPKAKEAQPFTNLKKEQLADFNQRVSKHLEEGQAEIVRMKEEHANKMAEWKKASSIMQAEKRLRYATWEGHESAVPAFRLEQVDVNGHAENGKKETVEDVVKDVEALLGVKISGHSEANMVEKGGLEKEEEQAPAPAVQPPQVEQQKGNMFEQHQQHPTGATNEPAMYHGDPMSNMPQQLPYAQPQEQQQTVQAQTMQPPQPDMGDGQAEDTQNDMNDTSMMDDIDMDVGDSNIDFGDTTLDTPGQDTPAAAIAAAEPSIAAPGAQSSDATATPGTTSQAATATTFGAQPAPQSQAGTTATSNLVGDSSTAAGPSGEEGEGGNIDDMFNDNTFGDLTNVDDAGGSEFLDFGDGEGMGMDDSAFGDAMHGMDSSGDNGQGGGGS